MHRCILKLSYMSVLWNGTVNFELSSMFLWAHISCSCISWPATAEPAAAVCLGLESSHVHNYHRERERVGSVSSDPQLFSRVLESRCVHIALTFTLTCTLPPSLTSVHCFVSRTHENSALLLQRSERAAKTLTAANPLSKSKQIHTPSLIGPTQSRGRFNFTRNEWAVPPC